MIQAPSNRQDRANPAPSGPVEPLETVSWPALGTTCLVQFPSAAQAAGRAFAAEAQAWVARFESRYSRYRPDSLVSAINAAAGRDWVAVDSEMAQMLELCGTIAFMTQGVLDVTATPLLRLWDFRRSPLTVPSATDIAAALRLVGWSKVRREPDRVFLPEAGMALDFGGWAKEFAVDAVAQLAATHGLSSVLVDFGRDLRAVGRPPGRTAWHIGVENPEAPGTCWGSIAVADLGVASSGDYVRSFMHDGRRYGHILDPRTGWPVANGCRQVTVVAPSCWQAGILSTTAFVLGPEAGLKLIQETFGADGCIVGARTRHQTRGFFRHVVQA